MTKFCIAGLSLLLVLCSCGQETAECPKEQLFTHGIIHKVKHGTEDGIPWIQAWSVKDTQLESMANLSIFGEFRPGITFEEANQKFGNPNSTRTAKNPTVFHCYTRTNATLAVAREHYFNTSPADDRWTVWAFPRDGGFPLPSVVSSNVLGQIDLPSPPFKLVLRDATPREESLWLTADSNGVSEIRWIRGH